MGAFYDGHLNWLIIYSYRQSFTMKRSSKNSVEEGIRAVQDRHSSWRIEEIAGSLTYTERKTTTKHPILVGRKQRDRLVSSAPRRGGTFTHDDHRFCAVVSGIKSPRAKDMTPDRAESLSYGLPRAKQALSPAPARPRHQTRLNA